MNLLICYFNPRNFFIIYFFYTYLKFFVFFLLDQKVRILDPFSLKNFILLTRRVRVIEGITE